MFVRKPANKISLSKRRPLFGIAINDAWYVTQLGKSGYCPIYRKWKDMITRVYSEKMHKKNPTYIGVTVCEEWLTFSNFLKWYEENYIDGFDLDKDLKVKGNKLYSPETCMFVPPAVNRLFADKPNLNKSLPTGVSFHEPTGKYRARVNRKYLGLFDRKEDASKAYAEAKNKEIKIFMCQYPELKIVLSQYLSDTIKSTEF
jgi:hypothetical protein